MDIEDINKQIKGKVIDKIELIEAAAATDIVNIYFTDNSFISIESSEWIPDISLIDVNLNNINNK